MRIFILSLILLAEVVIESTILTFFRIKGVTPDIVLITIIAIGLIYGKKEGVFIGFMGGVLSDILYGSVFGLHALPFMLIGYFMGMISERVYRDNRIIPFLFTIIGTFIYHVYFYFIQYLMGVDFNAYDYLRNFTTISLIINAILIILVYPLFLKLSEWNLLRDN